MVRPMPLVLWLQRLFAAVTAITAALILAGPLFIPTTRASSSWIISTLGAMGMQGALAVVALAGPWSFRRQQAVIRISGALGLVFALAYVGVILLEFQGVQTGVNIVALFVGVAVVTGLVAGYRTGRWRQGAPAGIWALLIGTALWSAAVLVIYYTTWGSRQWYAFWLADGAVDEFRRSGGHNFGAFVLQDIQGALFFHPLLSVVLGGIGGLTGSSAAWGVATLRRSPRKASAQRRPRGDEGQG